MLTLHHAPNSVCSQKVRVGMAMMGLTYDSVLLDLFKGDQFKPDYLELNRDAVVPTLVDGARVVTESSVILAYLDREHNGAQLTPPDAVGRVNAELWLLRCLGIHAAINTMSFSTVMRKQLLASKSFVELEAHAAKMPDPVMGAKRLDLISNGLASPYVQQAMVHLHRLFRDMQSTLSARPWMHGDALGIVDIALIAYVDRLDRLGMSGLWGAYPQIAAWLVKWQTTDAYRIGITDWVPEGSEEKMRADGAVHWEEIETVWQAFA